MKSQQKTGEKMDIFVLLLFCAVLTVCVGFNVSIVYALIVGLVIFGVYAKLKNFSWRQLFGMVMSGVKTVKNMLLIFLLIGVLTALWRLCGTIPVIICYAVKLIKPGAFLLMAFLLNCLISVLTGTAFGTAATMGVICMTMGSAMSVSPMLLGGAILAGVFFGDRCSPVSTSALLVSELTKTSIYTNIKNMLRSAAVPFCLTCAVYAGVGFFTNHSGSVLDLNALFGREFNLHWVAIVPAVLILALSLFKVNVKITMAASIASAFLISVFVQHAQLGEVFKTMVFGYTSLNEQTASMLGGGGVVSMLRVTAIVCISSAYVGIFQKTGLLGSVKRFIDTLSKKSTPYAATLLTSALTAMIACNQALAIMLTHQLCSGLESDSERTALNLENTAVVVSPLVPWSIAGAVPLSTVGAPPSARVFAVYLSLLPLCALVFSFIQIRRKAKIPVKV